MILSHVKLHTLQTYSYGFNPKWIITLLEKWLWTSFLPSFDLECHADYRESFHFPVSDRYLVNSVADISTSNWNKFWATQCRALSNQYTFKTKQKYPEIRHNYNAVGKMSLREFSRRRSRVEIFKMFKITVSEKLLWSSKLLKDRTECLILITLYDTYTKHRANKETPHVQACRIIITYPFLLPSPLTCRRPETKHRCSSLSSLSTLVSYLSFTLFWKSKSLRGNPSGDFSSKALQQLRFGSTGPYWLAKHRELGCCVEM